MMTLSKRLGVLASGLQVTAAFVFNFVSKVLGSFLYLLCGMFWVLESTVEDLSHRDFHFPRARKNIKDQAHAAFNKSNYIAGLTIVLSGILSVAAVFVGSTLASILIWPIIGLNVLCGVFWYQSAQDAYNQMAAVMHGISSVFLLATTLALMYVSTPIVAPTFIVLLGTATIGFEIMSAACWLLSYFLPENQSIIQPKLQTPPVIYRETDETPEVSVKMFLPSRPPVLIDDYEPLPEAFIRNKGLRKVGNISYN